MTDQDDVVRAAQRLAHEKELPALEVLVGTRAMAIEQDPGLADDAEFEPEYPTETMGALTEIKQLGRRILKRWNKELHDLVCSDTETDQKTRSAILDSLSIGEAAVIAAVAGALLSLGVGAALAAPLAPLIVKKFIWPARHELCAAWSEAIAAQN
jgi:hypothetical protein